MKVRSIVLSIFLGGGAVLVSSCANSSVPPEFSREWKFSDFAASAKTPKEKEEEWIWVLPPFYLEAADVFAPVGQAGDTVMVYCSDSPDHSVYRYSLVRDGVVIKQCQYRLPKRI